MELASPPWERRFPNDESTPSDARHAPRESPTNGKRWDDRYTPYDNPSEFLERIERGSTILVEHVTNPEKATR